MIRRLGGHLGGGWVAALVDGQLPPQDAERLWRHVLCCRSCRAAVERETWVKNRLAGLSRADPSPGLDSALGGRLPDPEQGERLVPGLRARWPSAGSEDCRRSRRLGLVAVGAGSVGAAVLGLTAVSATVDLPEPPVGSSIRDGVAGSPTPTPDRPPTAVLEPAVRLRVLNGRAGGRAHRDELIDQNAAVATPAATVGRASPALR